MKPKTNIKNYGVTLVELIIIIAVGVIVFGLILGILISTSKAVGKGMKSESVISEAENDLEKISSFINNIVIDESVKLAIAKKNQAKFLYSPEKLGIWTSSMNKADPYTYIELFNNKQIDPPKIYVADVELGTNKRTDSPLGPGFEDVATELSFRYATDFQNDEPLWKDSIPADTIPALIEVKISAKSTEKEVKPLEIITTYKTF